MSKKNYKQPQTAVYSLQPEMLIAQSGGTNPGGSDGNKPEEGANEDGFGKSSKKIWS